MLSKSIFINRIYSISNSSGQLNFLKIQNFVFQIKIQKNNI